MRRHRLLYTVSTCTVLLVAVSLSWWRQGRAGLVGCAAGAGLGWLVSQINQRLLRTAFRPGRGDLVKPVLGSLVVSWVALLGAMVLVGRIWPKSLVSFALTGTAVYLVHRFADVVAACHGTGVPTSRVETDPDTE